MNCVSRKHQQRKLKQFEMDIGRLKIGIKTAEQTNEGSAKQQSEIQSKFINMEKVIQAQTKTYMGLKRKTELQKTDDDANSKK